MKTCLGLLLALSVSVVGCAPGYYETGSSYKEPPSGGGFISMSFNNPETPEQKTMRIWRESIGR